MLPVCKFIIAILQREAQGLSRIASLVNRLAQISDGLIEISGLGGTQEILQATGSLLEQAIPHDSRCLGGLGNPLLRDYGQGLASAQRVHFDDPASSPVSSFAALLSVPLGESGAAVLARRSSAFSSDDQDLLRVVAGQTALALKTVRLTGELEQSRKSLVQSSKMAALGQIAGGVAHELNTPLGAIGLAVDGALAALPARPERVESRLRRAGISVQQMKEIVAKLLSFARVSPGGESGRRMTGLNQVIEDTLSLIGHQLRLDEVQVETHFGELPALLANKNELQQVFTNLCLNARDAVVAPRARARKILVTTSLRRDVVEASVRDWGYGMSADVRDRVFEAFFTTKDEGKGTGLGLSVSCQLIQQHGGKIAVESSPGEGTVFTVSLPWAVSQE